MLFWAQKNVFKKGYLEQNKLKTNAKNGKINSDKNKPIKMDQKKIKKSLIFAEICDLFMIFYKTYND